MSTAAASDQTRPFIQLWAEGLSLVLAQIAGKPFSFEAAQDSPEGSPAAATDVYVSVNAAGVVRGGSASAFRKRARSIWQRVLLAKPPG
jgi:hypothetical protein